MIRANVRTMSLLVVSGAMACSSTSTGTGEDETVRVDDVTPREGDYGTTITVKGQNLEGQSVFGVDPSGARIQLLAAPGPKKTPSKSSVDAGADAAPPGTMLTFRFPFPAEGEMTLVGPGGEMSIGAFTPTFTPGRPFDLESDAGVLGAAALGADAAVLVKRSSGIAFVVFGAGDPRAVDVENVPSAPESAWVREANGAIEALVEVNGAPLLVTFDGTRATARPYAALDGSYVGAGVEEAGFVIVMQGSGGIVRYRGTPEAPEADGPGVPLPSGSRARLAVSGDGTVVRAFASEAGNTFDDMVAFSMAGLGPKEQTFGAAVSLGSLDDTFQSLDASVSAGVVSLSYCATDTGIASSPETHCGKASTVDGRSKLSIADATALSYAAGRVAFASCQDNGIVLGSGPPEGQPTMEPMTALYPCGGAQVEALVTDAGGMRVVARTDGKLYVARRR